MQVLNNFIIIIKFLMSDAVDMSLAQNALLELKLGAIRISLTHEEFLQLLGEAPSTKRYTVCHACSLTCII